ncbi:hypothetical protein C8R43DRAFT_1147594 [Mycena crocata]|nr:hypothetical protein C8R43DRAFT_1147594 [Mycena crocata]
MSSALSEDMKEVLHYGTKINDYACLIAFVLLCYDHILTFDLEVAYIWKRPQGHGSVLFLFIRYFSLLANIANIVSGLAHFSAQYVVIGNVLGLRVYAMWNFSKRVLCLLCTLGAATTIVAVWSMTGHQVWEADNEPACQIGLSKQTAIRMSGAWEAQFVCDLVVFVMTVARSHRRLFQMPGSIVDLMVIDGAIYFGVIALVNLGNILMFHLGDVNQTYPFVISIREADSAIAMDGRKPILVRCNNINHRGIAFDAQPA